MIAQLDYVGKKRQINGTNQEGKGLIIQPGAVQHQLRKMV
jgi:hypothetical protein